jgi:hypothetical protein
MPLFFGEGSSVGWLSRQAMGPSVGFLQDQQRGFKIVVAALDWW